MWFLELPRQLKLIFSNSNTSPYASVNKAILIFAGGRTDSIGESTKEKRCGTRKFTEQVLPENEAIMGEFPWACSLFTQGIGGNEEKYLGGCTIIPNGKDNDIQKPTYRVITAASKVKLAANE